MDKFTRDRAHLSWRRRVLVALPACVGLLTPGTYAMLCFVSKVTIMEERSARACRTTCREWSSCSPSLETRPPEGGNNLAPTTRSPNLSFVPGRFFGRSSELTALRALFNDAFDRADAAAAMVLGEPGSGKSRLLAELPALAAPVAVISMAGFEPERDVAFAASHRLLGALRAEIPRAINPLEFEASGESTPVEPVRVFEAVHRALAGRGQTVLLVDDVHWVDDTSVALLHYVVRAAATSRQTLVVVFASRPSDVALSVMGSLRRVLQPGRLLEIELGPLEREDAVRLARDLDPQVTEDRAIEAWTTSGGSPFWLHLLATSEHLELDTGRILSDRLRPCGIDGETLLALLAVVARPIPIEDVMDVQAWRRPRVERALTTLEHAGLAVRQSGSVSVAHDLIQQTILGTISADRARRLHRRLGVWLQATAGDDEQLLLEALEASTSRRRPECGARDQARRVVTQVPRGRRARQTGLRRGRGRPSNGRGATASRRSRFAGVRPRTA